MTFKDISSQGIPIKILKSHVRSQRLGKAYLFCGPEGTGKKLIARIFAKALNCRQDNPDSCDSCASCLKIEKNSHPDVHIIGEGTEAIKIEDIRQLHKDISLRPYEAKIKVFIIDNAHNLTAEAANALLKVLEEPPQNTLLILISAKPALLFKTIISRCQILKFYPMPRQQLESALNKDYGLENPAAHFLAYFCEGRLGGALRLKDTPIIEDKNRLIDAFISRERLFDNLDSADKEEIARGLNILTTWFRDLYLLKAGMPNSEIINLDRRDELLRAASDYTFLDLNRIIKSIASSLLYLGQNLNSKLLLSNLRAELWKR